jgi:hypothetical protein
VAGTNDECYEYPIYSAEMTNADYFNREIEANVSKRAVVAV